MEKNRERSTGPRSLGSRRVRESRFSICWEQNTQPCAGQGGHRLDQRQKNTDLRKGTHKLKEENPRVLKDSGLGEPL